MEIKFNNNPIFPDNLPDNYIETIKKLSRMKISRCIGTVIDKNVGGEHISMYVPNNDNKLFIDMKNNSQSRRVYQDELDNYNSVIDADWK